MEDKYKELSDCLANLVDFVQRFEDEKNDLFKPKIRAYMVQSDQIAKSITGITFDHVKKLNSDIDNYLSKPSKKLFEKIIKDSIDVKNDLWEL